MDQQTAAETEREQEADRQLNELVQELRLVLPGTTVLFGFLLSLPFAAGSATLSTFDRVVYFIAFLAAGVAMIFLLAEAGFTACAGSHTTST